MKRTLLSLVFFTAIGLAASSAQAADLRSSGTRALPSMYHNFAGEEAMFVVVRNSPTSPAGQSESNKDHYSIGDKLVFSAPLYSTPELNRAGGKPVATFYGVATVVAGDTFANILTMLHFDFVFPNGDHIVGQGIVRSLAAKDLQQFAAITGGTGTYEGVRGAVHHRHGIDDLVINYGDN